ncbi:MAG TPA: dihydroorotate dehydrogenase-like protein [Myxococcota bacterium]|nr:dihydroorotate dehydrogenase-like protein [Myxococcota bacterium]HOH77040.1 dihydroorotate dehydrogenase-like protein [Myxococcota bacterium]
MANLKTRYMGLEIDSPLVAGSSGLTRDAAGVARLEGAGIGAVVLKSIFEEQVTHEVDGMAGPGTGVDAHPEAAEYIRAYGTAHAEENYLERITESVAAVRIPVIASIHCVQAGKWVDFARKAQQAGASGIELNVFVPPFDASVDGRQIEQLYIDIADSVRRVVTVPVSMKIGYHFTGMANFLKALSGHVDALVLFNRFFRMTIDTETMKLVPSVPYSEKHEHEISLRWVSGLFGVLGCDIAASTGINSADVAVKMILAGASAVQVSSVLYQGGVDSVGTINKGIAEWMDRHGFSSIEDFRGSVSRNYSTNQSQFDRVQFMKFSVGHE